MASIEAATALLTAESIIIAGGAILTRQFVGTYIEVRYLSRHRFLSGFTAAIFVMSFSLSLMYLHAAEYPAGFIGSLANVQRIFDFAILSLISGVFLGLFSLYYLEKGQKDRL